MDNYSELNNNNEPLHHYTPDVFFNFSDHRFNEKERQILSLNRKFAITPNFNKHAVHQDILLFTRSLRITNIFKNNINMETPINQYLRGLGQRSNYTPEKGLCKKLDNFIDMLGDSTTSFISEANQKNKNSNITKQQLETICMLRDNTNICFLEADKNGPLCVFNSMDYIELMEKEHLINNKDLVFI